MYSHLPYPEKSTLKKKEEDNVRSSFRSRPQVNQGSIEKTSGCHNMHMIGSKLMCNGERNLEINSNILYAHSLMLFSVFRTPATND